MRKLCLTILLICGALEARIGETVDQCAKRYGTTTRVGAQDSNGVSKTTYKKGDIVTTVWFLKGVCHKIEIYHKGRITRENLMEFLKPYERFGKLPNPAKGAANYRGENNSLIVTLTYNRITIEHKDLKRKIKENLDKNDPLKGF